MKRPQFSNKENLYELKVCQMNSSLVPPPHLLSLPQNMLRKPPTKTKPQKGFAASVRAGDWVCLRCKNLNFAFRSECNRCQMQLKDQTKFQTYISPEQSSPTENLQPRAPFQDLTNLRCALSNQSSLETFMNKDSSENIEKNLNQNAMSQNVPMKTRQASACENLKVDPNKGFNNVLLVTPPKRKNKSLDFLQEDWDLNQNELPPYKSPKHLPSITSMLEQVTGDQRRDQRSLHFIEEGTRGLENISDDNLQYSHQLMRDSNFFHFQNYGAEPEVQELESHKVLKERNSLANHD